MIEQTYKIVTAKDGIHWVSLQPIGQDLRRALTNGQITDPAVIEKMSIVHDFIQALITEGNHQLYQDEINNEQVKH